MLYCCASVDMLSVVILSAAMLSFRGATVGDRLEIKKKICNGSGNSGQDFSWNLSYKSFWTNLRKLWLNLRKLLL